MTSSILRKLLISFLTFGFFVAAVFPFYAHYFVEWKPGMLVWFVVGCMVAGLMIGVANYWLVNTILLNKLRRISEVANAISNKDLSFNCTMRSNDTIGEIITSFNAMSSNLRSLIGDTSSTSDSVRVASSDLHEMVRHIKSNVDTQAARAGEIEHAIEHLSGTVVEIAERSEKAAERAGQAGEHAGQGRRVVALTLDGMEKISHTVSEAAQAVESLGTSSQRIGAIVAVIKEIAEQTNLLALNAAIEAARAGEQGRGFAVVADEVRKLAEKTTHATQEIGTMISAIQSETAQAVRTMDTGKSEVEQGVEKAREAGEALQRIVDNVDTLSHMVREIADATHTQRADVQAVRSNTSDITSLIDDTVQRTESATNKTDALADQASRLHDSVKQFKLR